MGNLNDFGLFLTFPDLPGPAVNRCVCTAPLGNKFVFVVFLDPPGQVLILKLDFDFGLLEAKPQISKPDLNSRSSWSQIFNLKPDLNPGPLNPKPGSFSTDLFSKRACEAFLFASSPRLWISKLDF